MWYIVFVGEFFFFFFFYNDCVECNIGLLGVLC